MQIVIEPAPEQRYNATLYIDGEVIDFVNDKRAGCCVRTLMNRMILTYGKPMGKITVGIEGW